jgi:sugar phosphate permease
MKLSRITFIFAVFAAAHFLSYFFRTANAVIANDLTRDLALSADQLGLMTSLFYASFALIQLPVGSGLDRYGARLVTPALMLASAAGCVVFAIAPSFGAAALGRALIGVGMAGVLMGAIKVFGQWFPSNRVATISGFMVGISSMGSLLASRPLAWLSESVGWRAIFLWGAPVVLLAAAAIALVARNRPPASAPHPPAEHGEGIGLIFRDSRFWRIALMNFFLVGVMLSVQGLWGGPYLFDVLGLSKIAAGNILLVMGVGAVTGYFACGWLADRFGSERVSALGIVAFLACQVVFALPGLRPPLPLLTLTYGAMGFAGAFNIVLLAQVRGLFPQHMSGRALTAVNMFSFGGTTLIQWWMGVIISMFGRDDLGRYPPEAYAAAFAFTSVGTALALIGYLPFVRAGRVAASSVPSSAIE